MQPTLLLAWLTPLALSLSAGVPSRSGPPASASASTAQQTAVPSTAFAASERSSSARDDEVFCNRALSMNKIQAVGFDMDYTLAEYIPETFDLLAYEGAVEKLVQMGYPEAIREFEYDGHNYQRGLVIDKQRGNLIKLDRHKYVKVAYHGHRQLSSKERKLLYAQSFDTQPTFTPPQFASVDTAFQLVDSSLYCQLVSYKNEHPEEIPASYEQIYKHVRRAVDLCHCDGVIKDAVAVCPSKYIKQAPELGRLLDALRQSGKQVFILTNSLYDYTEVVMRYLLGEQWLDFFDLVICGARKPGFLLDPYLPIFQVNPDGSLINVEMGGGASSVQKVLSEGKVFQGGNWNHLHRLLRLNNGPGLLYVGDHMYSDILRSKRTLGWRTLLIVPELEEEMLVAQRTQFLRARVEALYERRAQLDASLGQVAMQRLRLWEDAAEAAAQQGGSERVAPDPAAMEVLSLAESDLVAQLEEVSEHWREALLGEHEAFHPRWGKVFKAGHQNSRWAQQVQEYACLYTSKVTNLALCSADTSFRALSDLMPHDRAAGSVSASSQLSSDLP